MIPLQVCVCVWGGEDKKQNKDRMRNFNLQSLKKNPYKLHKNN